MAPFGDTRQPMLVETDHKIARKPVAVRSSTQYTYFTVETPLETPCSPPDAKDKKWAGRIGASEKSASTDDGRVMTDGVSVHPPWRPHWLRPVALAGFAGLFLCITIALPVMLWYSERNDGIVKTTQDFGYVWRFGPTAVFTLIAAFWTRVELQSMRYMPWIALRRGQPLDPDLDYTAMLMPAVLYQSLRRKHWLVFLVSVTSLLLRAEIVLAPGLFRLAPIRVREPVDIKTRDSFNLNWSTADYYRETLIGYYAARAIHDFDMAYPFGVTGEAAYQTFQLTKDGSRGTTTAPLRTEVDAFFTNMTCLKLESYSVTNIQNASTSSTTGNLQPSETYGRYYFANVSLLFEGCQQEVPIRVATSDRPRTGGDKALLTTGNFENSWYVINSLEPLPRPCPGLPQQHPQFLYYAGQFERFKNGNSTASQRVEHKTLGAVLCSQTAWVSKAEVDDDGISPNVTALDGTPTTPVETDLWKILGEAVPRTPGGWTSRTQSGEDYGPVTGELSFAGTRDFADTTDKLYNTTISLYRRLAPLLGHYLFRAEQEGAGVGETSTAVDKLEFNRQVCWAMIAVAAAMTVIVSLVLVRSRRHTQVWHRDPATILGSLLFLNDHPSLREASERDDETLKRSWSECSFSPLIIRPWVQFVFTIFVCGLLVGLGTTLQSSIEHHGLATVDETGYWYLLWTSLPAMIMLGVSLYTSSNDFVLRSLSTLYNLSVRPCTSKQLDSSMLDMLGIRALYEASRQRSWTIATSQTMALICGILATLATILFSVETVPTSVAMQLDQKSWFGNVDIPKYNETSEFQHNRANLRSLLVWKGEANVTYPKNTYADMAFPLIDESRLYLLNATKQSTIHLRMPAAKLTSSCQRLPNDKFNITLSNYTEASGEFTKETVYQGPMLTWEKCPDGKLAMLGQQFVVGRNQTGNNPGTSYFADILDSPGNIFHMNQQCKLNITDVNDMLGTTLQKTYVWGQWNYLEAKFDLLRFWRCDYFWSVVMTDVTLVKGADGQLTIDQNNPPVPDMSTATSFDPPMNVLPDDRDLAKSYAGSMPELGSANPDIFVSDPSAGDVNPSFRPMIQPYGTLAPEAFGDPAMEDRILEALHANWGFSSAQTLNLENRLGVGEPSRTAPFPAAGLAPVEAVVVDDGRRRLVQNATVTYVVVAILGFVACMNIWTVFSRVMRRYAGVQWRWFSMDVRGLAPDRFGSLGLTASLLWDSNAAENIPARSRAVATGDVHGMLSDLRFRLGWFRRGADGERRFTVGVLGDEKFQWVESKAEREGKGRMVPKGLYEKVGNGSEETGYRGGEGEIILFKMSFKVDSDLKRPNTWEEHFTDIIGGNVAVAKWRHVPDESTFDDDEAFRIIRDAILEQHNDPQRLRKTAIEIAGLLPAQQSADYLSSLWSLFISLAQQTPSSNVAMLDLVVILDHLSMSPKTTITVTVDGFEQLSRLHGLNQSVRNRMVSPHVSDEAMETLTRWININAFAALLWSYNLIDGRDHAIQQLRSAFEEDRRSSDVNGKDAADARLMAAAQWAIYSCQRLYHLSVTSEATSPSPADGSSNCDKRWKPGARFKGRSGFSFRRWEFWQQGFEEAHDFGGGGIEAKVEAEAAGGMMEKVLYAGFEVI
ncbi:hypothetical protein CkaCkLH20_06067 [Colletotrichum karsti]|uniref:Uncharacterized protein n=1 Tax=Colletotrichum karsti TaxID=1095194 RepID=A0A9P6LHU6_9PEZI|nr:uncharacterized protein CkaCkLH20_06067 [Colletotrichum karsti]KAF9876659.1 hypothetical protein CkaCkLH20_06067 [Colletotrichum karsti]